MNFFDIFKIKEFKYQISILQQENDALQQSNNTLTEKLTEIGANDYFAMQKKN